MKQIPLTKGQFALVDDEDFEIISSIKWHAFFKANNCYAISRKKVNGVKTCLYMHSLILDIPKGLRCDHKDRNGLNNQRSNLRISTASQNAINCKKYSSNSSGFRGVSKQGGYKFRSTISRKILGYFDTAIEAANVYDDAALELYGEFANLNFPIIYG